VANKCRLEQLIARGGMGAVWAAWDTALERPVAIKFMDVAVAASKALRIRFNREAKAAAKLRTPHVVQIFEHGVHRGLPYIVMELLEGEDLHDRLKRERRLTLKATAKIAREAAKALRRAHSKGIIHRDLKPRNIFIAVDDEDEVVKILDFGIAKSLGQDADEETTKTGQVLGSPAFMSPEQARGFRNIDHRTDLWSLGVILFRAVTGTTPFRGEASGDIIVKICTEEVPVPSTIAPDLPPAVDEFFARVLARDPDDRFQSAMELAQAFTEVARAAVGAPLSPGATSPNLTDPGEWTPLSDPGTPGPGSGSNPSFDFGSSASGVGLSSPSLSGVPSTSLEHVDTGSDLRSAPPMTADVPAAAEVPSDPGSATPWPTIPGGLTDPAAGDLEGGWPTTRRKGLWAGIAAAGLAAVLGAVVLASGDEAPTSEGPNGSAPTGEPAATPGTTTAAASPSSLVDDSAGGAAGASSGGHNAAGAVQTASAKPSATAAETASATKVEAPPRVSPPPKPRPPRPAPTPSKRKWNWGY